MQGGAAGRGKGPGEVRVLWQLLVCSNRGFPGEISVLCSLSSLLSWPQAQVPVPCSQQLCELKMLQVCCMSPLGRNYTLFLATDGFSPSELTPRCYYRLWDQLRFQPGEEADQRWSVAISSQLK